MPFFNGKEGRWITVKGNHIFISDGENVQDAINKFFNSDSFDDDYEYDDNYEPDFDTYFTFEEYEEPKKPEPKPEPEYKDSDYKKEKLKAFKGIWDASYAKIKNRFIDQFMRHKVNDKEMEDILFDMLKKKDKIQRVWIKSEYTSGGTYYNRFYKKIVMNIQDNNENYSQTMGNLFHEMGHALDNNGVGKYYSSSYVSSKHGVTLAQMLKTELSENESKIDELLQEYQNIERYKNLLYDDWKAGKITNEFRLNEKARAYYGAALSIVDTVQGTYGLQYVRDKFGNWTHPAGYFDYESKGNPEYAESWNATNRGTEFFAEMTDDLVNDHEHIFSNLMKKHAPKSVEIYYEILKEMYGYGSK